jgi:hypothetical protein
MDYCRSEGSRPDSTSMTRPEIRNRRHRDNGTYVGVVHDRCDDPEEKNEAKEDVYFGPPWKHQWATKPHDLCPIERYYAHTHARVDAE